MSDGIGCICGAYYSGECCCDVDWTPQIQYDLEAEIIRLRKIEDAARMVVNTRNCDDAELLLLEDRLYGVYI